MKILRYLSIFVLLAGTSQHTLHAQTVQNIEQQAIDEVNAGICMMASHGVFIAAKERQAGTSKEKTQKILATEFKKVQKNFGKNHHQTVEFVDSAWKKGLDIVYKNPVYDDEATKKTFVSQATEASFLSCLDNLEN